MDALEDWSCPNVGLPGVGKPRAVCPACSKIATKCTSISTKAIVPTCGRERPGPCVGTRRSSCGYSAMKKSGTSVIQTTWTPLPLATRTMRRLQRASAVRRPSSQITSDREGMPLARSASPDIPRTRQGPKRSAASAEDGASGWAAPSPVTNTLRAPASVAIARGGAARSMLPYVRANRRTLPAETPLGACRV